MGRGARFLWFAFVLGLIVCVIAVEPESIAGVIKGVWSSYLRPPLGRQILIGFAVWLGSVILPFMFYRFLVEPPEEGPPLSWLFAFFIIWPPAWPLAIIFIVLIKVLDR